MSTKTATAQPEPTLTDRQRERLEAFIDSNPRMMLPQVAEHMSRELGCKVTRGHVTNACLAVALKRRKVEEASRPLTQKELSKCLDLMLGATQEWSGAYTGSPNEKPYSETCAMCERAVKQLKTALNLP